MPTTLPRLFHATVILLAVGWFSLAAHAEPYKPDPGLYAVEAFPLDLHDAERDCAVPIKVYRPVDADGPRPVVLVSHGLGGTREGLAYLGNHWASHGYVCIHMQHHGSDDSVWRDVPARERLQAMRRATMNPQNALNRAGDTTFVLDQLAAMNTDPGSRLHGELDLDRAGIAGHSFGSWTCLAAGGMTVGGRRGEPLRDERIRCMIPLSPPVTSNERRYEQTYGTFAIPALFMTGTLDTSPINDTTAAQRMIPYRYMNGVSEGGPPKYLINFDGADHMTFAGESRVSRRLRQADPDSDPVFHALILQSTTAFLDAYLLGDQDAIAWLNGGAFVEAVGDHGDVEMDAEPQS